MIEFYAQIRAVHIGCVIASGITFAVRGCLHLAGIGAPNHLALRGLSWSIDTTLLTAALMLATMLHQYPFVHSWLTVKLLLLVVYIVLGSVALRGQCSRRASALYFSAALLVYLAIISVARAHRPLGILQSLLS